MVYVALLDAPLIGVLSAVLSRLNRAFVVSKLGLQAIRHRNIELTRALLDDGIDPNMPPRFVAGSAPLLLAVSLNSSLFAAAAEPVFMEIATLLLLRGADPNWKTSLCKGINPGHAEGDFALRVSQPSPHARTRALIPSTT